MSQYCHRESEDGRIYLVVCLPCCCSTYLDIPGPAQICHFIMLILRLSSLLADAIARLIPAMSGRKTTSCTSHTSSQAPPLDLDRVMRMVTKRSLILCTVRALCCKLLQRTNDADYPARAIYLSACLFAFRCFFLRRFFSAADSFADPSSGADALLSSPPLARCASAVPFVSRLSAPCGSAAMAASQNAGPVMSVCLLRYNSKSKANTA